MNTAPGSIHLLRPLGLAMGTCLVLILGYAFGLFDAAERRAYDLRLRWNTPRTPARQDIVLLMITQESLDSLKEGDRRMPWPWPRSVYGNVIDYCSSSGARAVLFDLFLSEPSWWGPEDDQAMADAASAFGRVSVAMAGEDRERAKPDPSWLDRLALPVRHGPNPPAWPVHRSVTPPVEVLGRSVRWTADVKNYPDPDGVTRRYALAGRYRDRIIPSLALAAVMEATGAGHIHVSDQGMVHAGSVRIPVDPSGQILIRYSGADPPLRRYDIKDVLVSVEQAAGGRTPKIPPSAFKDKIVLVGASAPGLLDLRVTPFSDVTPGVEIHATALNQILNGEFIIRPAYAPVLGIAMMVFLGLATAVVMRLARASVAVVLVLVFAGAHGISNHLLFGSGLWLDVVGPLVAVGAVFCVVSVYNYATEGKRRRELKRAFERYLAPAVVEKVMERADRLTLSGERKNLTVLFLDFSGFTAMSETRDPVRVVQYLNRYHNAATEDIFRQEGVVNKFMGDAVMAFWGDPSVQPDHARRACVAAVRIQERLKELAGRMREEGGVEMRARIGINTGPMVVGNMGSERFFDYTVIGDEVNLASRLEGVNKEFGTEIIVGENTIREAGEAVEVRELAMIRVVGKSVPVRICEVLGLKGAVDPEKLKRVRRFSEALKRYRERDWARAEEMFSALAPEDAPSRLYVDLCRRFRAIPPGPDWDGSYEMHSK